MMLVYIPQNKDDFFSQTGKTGCYGQHEGGQSEGSVNWHQSGPEACRGSFTAQQDQEAEESDDKLCKKVIFQLLLNKLSQNAEVQ